MVWAFARQRCIASVSSVGYTCSVSDFGSGVGGFGVAFVTFSFVVLGPIMSLRL